MEGESDQEVRTASACLKRPLNESIPRSSLRPITTHEDMDMSSSMKSKMPWKDIARPSRFEHKRVKSWSSEGEAYGLLKSRYSDYEYDTDFEGSEDGYYSEEDEGGFNFYVDPLTTPKQSSAISTSLNQKELTASALALRHGAVLCRSQAEQNESSPVQRPLTASALALKHGATLSQELRKRNSSFRHQTSIPQSIMSVANSVPSVPSRGRKHQQSSWKRKAFVNPWLIPVNHPLKIAWDIFTVILSIVNVYLTHRFIRERQFQSRPGLIEICYMIDIILNFLTQRTTPDGTVLTSFTAVWARYLTSWFVIDVMALFPGEVLYIQPVIELQKKRKLWQKIFRRTKVTVKVTTRILQSGHVPWLYKVLVKARPIGELFRLIKLMIKYIPKYLLFVRNMKFVLLIRALRDWGHLRAFWRWTTYTVPIGTASCCGGGGGPEDLPPTVAGWTSEDEQGDVVEEDWETLNDSDEVMEPDEEEDDDDDHDSGPF